MTFIIEHPTRGTLKFLVSPEEFGFSRTGLRNDPENTMQFRSLAEASRVLALLPAKLRGEGKCQIRDSDASDDVDRGGYAVITGETVMQEIARLLS